MPLDRPACAAYGGDIGFAVAVIVAGNDDVSRRTEYNRIKTGSRLHSPESGLAAAIVSLNGKISFTVAVIVARCGEISILAPRHICHGSVCGRTIEPCTRVARTRPRTVYSEVILAVTVIVANNAGIVTGLSKCLLTKCRGRTVQNVKRRYGRCTGTPYGDVIFAVAVVITGYEFVGRNTPG